MASDLPENSSTVSKPAVIWRHTLSTAAIMALLGVLFSTLYAAFIFSGPLIGYMVPSVTVLLWGTAVMMLITAVFSGLRGVYAGIQDEAVVILATVATAIVADMGTKPPAGPRTPGPGGVQFQSPCLRSRQTVICRPRFP